MKKNILLLLVMLLLSVLLVEITLRVTGRYQSYTEKNSGQYVSPFCGSDGLSLHPFQKISYSKKEFVVNWTSNNEGLKEKILSVSKKGKRILNLGDSFTEGVGASNDSSYPRLFEQLVKQQCDSTFEIINAGLSGADLFTEYKLFSEKLLKYEPDYVLLTFNTTDYDEFVVRGGFERFSHDRNKNKDKAPWFEILYARSYLVRTVVHDVLRYNFLFLTNRQQQESNMLANKSMEAVLDSFQTICAIHHIQLGIIFHPRQFEIQQPQRYEARQLMIFCAQKKIPFTDAFLFFKQNNITAANSGSIFWQKDGHHNANGYALLAKDAFQFFSDSLWRGGVPN